MTPSDDDNSPTELPFAVGVCWGESGGWTSGEVVMEEGGDELKNEFNKCCKIKVIRRCEDEN